MASGACVFTSHLNCRSTILSGVKSTSVNPCCSIGLTCSSMSRCTGGNGVHIAADDEWDPSLHRGHRCHQAVMLLEPTRLPTGFWPVDGKSVVAAKHVPIPLAPFA